jgi:hypothetical protein
MRKHSFFQVVRVCMGSKCISSNIPWRLIVLASCEVSDKTCMACLSVRVTNFDRDDSICDEKLVA